MTAASSVLQSGPCIPRRRFWNKLCSGATSGNPALLTCSSKRSPGERGSASSPVGGTADTLSVHVFLMTYTLSVGKTVCLLNDWLSVLLSE